MPKFLLKRKRTITLPLFKIRGIDHVHTIDSLSIS